MMNENTQAVISAARRALAESKGHDHPVAESERLFEIYCDELDPVMGFGDSAAERRDILYNVAEGKNPWARRV
jgi:hypothetical protein